MRSATGLGLPIKPNTVADSAQLSALWLAPNEWLLVTPPGAHAELPAALRQALGNLFAAVVDVSSGYTTIEIRGPETRDLLARGCAVDLHPRVFGPGQCAQTLLAKAQVTIVKVGSPPRFHVIVRRSMAEYLWRWLDDAARDLSSSLGSGRER